MQLADLPPCCCVPVLLLTFAVVEAFAEAAPTAPLSFLPGWCRQQQPHVVLELHLPLLLPLPCGAARQGRWRQPLWTTRLQTAQRRLSGHVAAGGETQRAVAATGRASVQMLGLTMYSSVFHCTRSYLFIICMRLHICCTIPEQGVNSAAACCG